MGTDGSLLISPLTGLPEIGAGERLAELLAGALERLGLGARAGDVLVVTQKIVSKAEGAAVSLKSVEPSVFARSWAERWGRDPRLVELVLRESRRIVRMERGVIISETRHGFVCANAGIDLSNSGAAETALLLPQDPDHSARKLRDGLLALTGAEMGVIISDSFGRPWRRGLTQVALGVAGLNPLIDLRGEADSDGRPLAATLWAVADELAAAANLVCGKTSRIPAALIRGRPMDGKEAAGEAGTGADLLRSPEEDLFR